MDEAAQATPSAAPLTRIRPTRPPPRDINARCLLGCCLRPVGVSSNPLTPICSDADNAPWYHIGIQGEQFKFSCAHFVAFKGFRERLHGHNYTVAVQLHGPRSRHDGYVMDFGEVKKSIKAICKELNEYLLVPLHSDVITMRVDNERKQLSMVCEDETSFLIPLDDCKLLPLIHSTAEELAEWFHHRLIEMVGMERLTERGIMYMQVTISERITQGSTHSIRLQEASKM